jgi:uncharacterized membrane protein
MARKPKSARTQPVHHRLKAVRIVRGHLKLFIAALAGVVLFPFLPEALRLSTRLLTAWDFASFVYLVGAIILIRRFDLKRVQVRAEETDEGGPALLLITVLTALASLAAIVIELGSAREMKSPEAQQAAFILAAVTVILSWTLIHTIFAFHYVHVYYRGPGMHGRGLAFPGEGEPDYWDFVYFSFVIGMTFQVSDVQITGKNIRRLAIAHALVSFVFNVAILALTVNIGANLI